VKLLRIILVLFIIPFSAIANEELIRRAENYLNNLKTLRADFVQIDQNNKRSKGTFYLSRPGKMIWQYAEPSRIDLLLQGNRVVYYDHELDEVSNKKIEDEIITFLAKTSINFKNSFYIKEIKILENSFGLVLKPIKPSKDLEGQILSLYFRKENSQLFTIKIADEESLQRNTIHLYNQQENILIDNKVFAYPKKIIK